MRCLNCLTVCSPADPKCPSCNRPLALGTRRKSSGTGVPKYALICMVLGEAVFNTFGRQYFPSTSHGISTEFIMWGAVVGAGCAVAGGFLGMLLGGPGDAR